MLEHELDEARFDQVLRQALQEHSEPVPADFSRRVTEQIREAEERRILAQVVMQKRLGLASCIAFGIITVAVTALFPNITASFTEQVETFITKISRTAEMINYRQLLCMTAFWGMLGAIGCTFVYLFLDRNKGQV